MPWDQKKRPPSEYLPRHKQARVLRRHAGICHLCGHPDADQVDHVIGWAEWTRTDLSVHNESNLRPAHGRPCPTCGRTCHDDKTKTEAARGRARAHTQRHTHAHRPTEPHPGQLTAARPRPTGGGPPLP